MPFVTVAKLSEIPPRAGKLVRAGDSEIALFKRGTELWAISNVCAHQHFSMLHEGGADGFVVTCPMHGWAYDMRTGRGVGGQGTVRCYEVRVEGDMVSVNVGEEG